MPVPKNCPHCGKWKSTNGNSNFYRSNKSKSGFEHFACKSCILDLCTDVDPKTGVRTDNREKTINTFRQLDWKFNESDYNAQLQTINEGVGEKVRGTAVQNLIVMVASLPQYKNKTYKDSEFAIGDIENNTEDYVYDRDQRRQARRACGECREDAALRRQGDVMSRQPER